MIGNVDSVEIAIAKNPRESFMGELSPFPPIPREHSGRDEEVITRRKQRGCRCKQSKCLKLYCECFASGVLCTDCGCVDCHNNSDNCRVRKAALANVLGRSPNAVNGKPSSDDKQYEAAPVTKLGLRSKGCKCKRTKCLKKYCECFQANSLCSDDCKCVDCKNVSERFQPSVLGQGLDNIKLVGSYVKHENNAQGIISTNRDNISFNSHITAGVTNNAPGFPSHSSLQVHQRRRYQEPAEQWNSRPASIPDSSILKALRSPRSSSPKLPYRKKRSRLGYTTTHLLDLGGIYSLLLAASETATANAALNDPVIATQTGFEDQKGIYIKPDDFKQENIDIELSNESMSRNVEEEIESCGRLMELIDAQYNGEEDSQCEETDMYMEQERAVLETFRDYLQKLIQTGFTRG